MRFPHGHTVIVKDSLRHANDGDVSLGLVAHVVVQANRRDEESLLDQRERLLRIRSSCRDSQTFDVAPVEKKKMTPLRDSDAVESTVDVAVLVSVFIFVEANGEHMSKLFSA